MPFTIFPPPLADRGAHETVGSGVARLARRLALLLPSGVAVGVRGAQDGVAPEELHHAVHPAADLVLVRLVVAYLGPVARDPVPHDVQDEGIEPDEFPRYRPGEVVVLEPHRHGLPLGAVERAEEVVRDGPCEGVSVEVNLIQIGMRVEVGQGSGVRPRVRIVVVDGKSLEVPHVLDLRGQGTGELILGERDDLHFGEFPNLRWYRPRELVAVAVKFQEVRQVPEMLVDGPRQLVLAHGEYLKQRQTEQLGRHRPLEVVESHVQSREALGEPRHALHARHEVVRELDDLDVRDFVLLLDDHVDAVESRARDAILAQVEFPEVREGVHVRTHGSGEVVVLEVDLDYLTGVVALDAVIGAHVGVVGVPLFVPVVPVEVGVDVVQDLPLVEDGRAGEQRRQQQHDQ